MITTDQFVSKYRGKKIDFDGFYGGQCVDLFRQYLKEVLEVPQPDGVGGAAELWNTTSPDHFDQIKYTTGAVPQKGDIPIWNRKAGGGFGHVAIFLEGTSEKFTSFDQNWPTLNKCTVTEHDYKNIIGWLRPKKVFAADEKIYTESQMTDMRLERDANHNKYLEEKQLRMAVEKRLEETQDKLETALQMQAHTPSSDQVKTAIELLKSKHQEEINNLHLRYEKEVKQITEVAEGQNKDLKLLVSSLNNQLLDNRVSWKHRLTSRKFILTAPTAVFDMVIAFAILLGYQPDPAALATALGALNSVVAIFVIPEAITDHKERLISANR